MITAAPESRSRAPASAMLFTGMSSTPASRASVIFRRASPLISSSRARSSTSTFHPRAARWRAATRPSPPLRPLPASTTQRRPPGETIAGTTSATRRPALEFGHLRACHDVHTRVFPRRRDALLASTMRPGCVHLTHTTHIAHNPTYPHDLQSRKEGLGLTLYSPDVTATSEGRAPK